MYKIIDIGDEQVALLAKASTNVFYKQVFHEDPIAMQTRDNITNADQIDFSQRLTFVMSKQAEAQAAVTAGDVPSVRDFMQTVTEDDYIDWLDQFDFMALQEALGDAMSVYTANSNSTSKAKK